MKKIADSFDLDEPIRDDLFGHGSSFNNDEPPPDVDKMWKNFNKKLNNLLRLKKNKNGGGEDPDDDSENEKDTNSRGLQIILGIITGIAAFVWLSTGVYMVNEGQSAVITTFGRYTKTESSGMSWHIPWPIQDHEIIETGLIKSVEVGYRESLSAHKYEESLMMTSDGNMIDFQFSVQYRIASATDWLYNSRNPEDMIRLASENAFRQVTVTRPFKDLLYGSKDQVIAEVQKILNATVAKYKIGVEIVGVTVQSVRPPQPVQEAFADAEAAPKDVERMKNESENYTTSMVPKANAEAEQIKTDAEAYRRQAVVNAEAEAERFRQILPEYKQAPEVTKDRLYLETMEQIYANTDKVLIDSQKKPIVRLPVYNSGGYPVRAEEQGSCSGKAAKVSTLPDGSAVSTEATTATPDGSNEAPAARTRPAANDRKGDTAVRDRESRTRGGRS